jgi:uncharacterized protein YjgD (DUF1641 family)
MTMQQHHASPMRSSASDPTVALLERIDRRLAGIEERLDQLEGAARAVARPAAELPALAALAVDSFDDKIAALRERGVDVDAHARAALVALERLTSPEAIEVLTSVLDHTAEMKELLNSGVLDPATLRQLGRLAGAIAAAAQSSPPPVGVWGALRAARDPDTQRALGFAVDLAARFGAALGERELLALNAGNPKGGV